MFYGSSILEDREDNLCLLCGREVKGDADHCPDCISDMGEEEAGEELVDEL